MNKQKELPGMPERDKLGKAAVEYLNKRDALKKSQDETNMAKETLAVEVQRAGCKQIKVNDYTLTYMHSEKDTITVKEGRSGSLIYR